MWKHPSSLVILAFTLLGAGMAPNAADAHDMPAEAESVSAIGASAAFDAHGRLWVASTRGDHVVLRHSDDLGKTLSRPTIVNPVAESIYANSENRPKVATGADGAIYVQWTQQSGPGWVGAIRFARSVDGGKHFSAPVTVNRGPPQVTRGFDSLVVADNGDVVVAWIDARDAVQAKASGKPYAGFAFYYSRSRDGGRTFAPERKLADHTCECCRTALARGIDGGIAAFFRGIQGDNIRDHAFAELHVDGSASRPRRATFSNWQVPACPDQGPGLAIGAHGTIHATWYEASHGPAIWYGQLDPGHPPRHPLKIGGAGASHADVASEGATVWIAWNQVNAEGYALMLRTSHDGGAHFGASRIIASSTVPVDSPHLLTCRGQPCVAWNTASGFRLIRATAGDP